MSFNLAMNSGVSALQAFSKGMEVIGNNISNIESTAFKSQQARYGDNFYDFIGNYGHGTVSTANQSGTGVHVNNIASNFTQGDIRETGRKDDLAIFGDSFFRVQNPDSGEDFFTRDGAFFWNEDAAGTTANLVTGNGYNVLDVTGGTITRTLRDADGNPLDYTFAFPGTEGLGVLTVLNADGSVNAATEIGLSKFTNPDGLERAASNLFQASDRSGAAQDRANRTEEGFGAVLDQSLELSNADLTREFTSMITTQRGFQAGSRIITTSDQLMQEVINLKR
jgi:flagellar hook protein FlgE